MGNIVGEKFDDFVINQINARQSLSGAGFGSATLTPNQLLLLNNRNAWLKLASSVSVMDLTTVVDPITKTNRAGTYIEPGSTTIQPFGTNRLKDIGISDTTSFMGNLLSQKTVLFNTLSEFTPTTYKKNEAGELTDQIDIAGSYNFRSGVTTSNTLWNSSNSYGLGGSNFGLTPAPGLISAKIDCKNRGSIRTADIEIKAFNQFQFEMIELVYLRLGFTMMLEWGWDKYTTNGNNIINMGNTIIEDRWFNNNPVSQLDMLGNIQEYRGKYAGNYDGFFGKVVNFDWNFNKNGSYDIKLKLVTLGDVIESLKIKPSSSPIPLNKIDTLISGSKGGEQKRLEGIKDSTMVTNAGSSPIAQSLYVDVINFELWGDSNPNYFSFNNQKELNLEDTFSDDMSVVKENKPLQASDQFSYYMTFDTLLNRIEKYCVPGVGSKGNIGKQIKISPIGNDNLCSAYPNQISFDPKVCLIRPIFTNSMVGGGSVENPTIQPWGWFNKLKQFGVLDKNNTLLYGNIMNIYLNYDFISNCLTQNTDKDGNISVYKFLEKICNGINNALGNFQQIETVIRDDIYVTIQDQNPIPGLELIYPNTAITNITPFEIFGFNTTGSVSSNFVTDFSFNTKITPQLASMISIGTTANNITTKNYDGTAFSKWNSGLQDRFASYYEDPDEVESIEGKHDKGSNTLNDKQLEDEFNAFKNAGGVVTEDNIRRNRSNTSLIKPNPQSVTKYNYTANILNGVKPLASNIKSPITGKIYGTDFLGSLTWPMYITKVEEDYILNKTRLKNNKFTLAEINGIYKNDYRWYLIRAFSGQLPLKEVGSDFGTINRPLSQYYLMNPGFIEEGKNIFNNYILSNNINPQYNDTNSPSNTIGYIPADLSLTFKGLSGVKIYQQLAVRQEFLPKQYPKALKFLIKGINHSISNNDWSTNLGTLCVPNVEAKLNVDNTPKSNSLLSSGLINQEFTGPTPNADILRVNLFSIGYSEKNSELSSNGDITEKLANTASQIFQAINNKFGLGLRVEVTGGNDIYHKNLDSKHKFGIALDFTISPISEENIKAVVEILKYYSRQRIINYLDEYTKPSEKATGGHFHFSVN